MSSISKFKRVILGAVAAISLSPAAHAAGDVYDKQVWQETGRGWQVDYVPAVNSCVVGRPHDNNVSLQIFYQPDSDSFTFRILSSKWSAVENGATYDINVRMDGGANRWHAKARGFWTNDGYPGIAIFGVKVAFLKGFMDRNRIDFYNATSGAWITALALDGSAAAMVGLVDCLDAHKSWNRNGGAQPQPSKPQPREFQT